MFSFQQVSLHTRRSTIMVRPMGCITSRRRRQQEGALLMDALFALTLAALVILTCAALSISSLAAHEVAKQQNVATNAARKVVENLRAFKHAAVSPGVYADASVFGSVPQLQLLTRGTADLTLTQARGSLKMAVVTVRWQSGIPRRNQSLSIAIYLAKEGFAQ